MPRVSPRVNSGLWQRGAIHQYRTRVPADLVTLMGTSRISHSLKTASLTVARRLAKTMAFEIEQPCEVVRAAGGIVAKPGMQGRKLIPGITLALASERYLTDPTISRSPKSQLVYLTTLTTLVKTSIRDLAPTAVTIDIFREVLKVLQRFRAVSRKPNSSITLGLGVEVLKSSISFPKS